MSTIHTLIQRIAKPTCELGLTTHRGIHSTSAALAGARYRQAQGRETHVNMSR